MHIGGRYGTIIFGLKAVLSCPSTMLSGFWAGDRETAENMKCRCDGIGRRDGLKIRWANHPCGFESHHRHQNLTARRPLIYRGCGLFYVAVKIPPAMQGEGRSLDKSSSCARMNEE